jgi:nucleoside 2-deoxyribosyltransferase
MKVYLAATFSQQARMRDVRDSLFKLGHNVLSTWLNEQIKPAGMTDEQFGRKMAAKDFREIQEADCFILDMAVPSRTAGKYIEYGFAQAHHKLIYVVKSGEEVTTGHIFLRVADMIFETWDEAYEYFKLVHPGKQENDYVTLSNELNQAFVGAHPLKSNPVGAGSVSAGLGLNLL